MSKVKLSNTWSKILSDLDKWGTTPESGNDWSEQSEDFVHFAWEHRDAILSALRLAESPSVAEGVERERERILTEREANAKIADAQADAIHLPRDKNGKADRKDGFTKQLVAMKVVSRDIAAAIRARSTKEEGI